MSLKFPISLAGKRGGGFPQPLHWWDLDDDEVWSNDGSSASAFSLTEGSANPTVVVGGGPNGQDIADVSARNKYLLGADGAYDSSNTSAISYGCWFNKLYQGQGVLMAWHLATAGGTAPSAGPRLFDIFTDGGTPNYGLYARTYSVDGHKIENKILSQFPNDGTWSHVFVTLDANTGEQKLYIDGSLYNTITNASFTTLNNVDTIRFAAGTMPNSLGTTGGFHRGYLGMMGVWDTLLDADQVAYLYNSGLGRQYADL